MGFEVAHIKTLEENWQDHFYIMLMRPEHKPPHLGIMAQGQYFSLSVKGNALGEEGTVWKHKLERKNLPVLWVKFDPIDIVYIREVFEKFDQHTALGEITCLAPIKEIIGIEADYIFELIAYMEQENKIIGYFSTALSKAKVEIPFYSMEEIQSCITHHKSKQNV